VSQGIIPTDNMVKGFADNAGISGPSYYHYPGREGSAPSSFGAAQNLAAPLPLFPDFRDGDRDYPNGWIDQGPIRYRYSCSTCHSPHGTALPNDTPAAIGFPDLRMGRKSPNELCRQCH
jgi:mono/diheme cytochrome c family protein